MKLEGSEATGSWSWFPIRMGGMSSHLLCLNDCWVPGDSMLRESRVGMGDFRGLIPTAGRQWYCLPGQSCCSCSPGNIWPVSSQTKGPVLVMLSLKLWDFMDIFIHLPSADLKSRHWFQSPDQDSCMSCCLAWFHVAYAKIWKPGGDILITLTICRSQAITSS